jgi:hypothetical protein
MHENKNSEDALAHIGEHCSHLGENKKQKFFNFTDCHRSVGLEPTIANRPDEARTSDPKAAKKHSTLQIL